MFNRALFSQRTNSLPKHETNSKPNPHISDLAKNKINIRRATSNQALLSSLTDKNPSNLVKVIPQTLQFQSVEPQQLYEIPFFIRNESSQLQKVRIIPPVKKQFKIKFAQNFNNEIAAGLAVKIFVLFCSDEPFEIVVDKIIVMGNSFKHELIIIAQTPKPSFVIPQVLSVGTLVLKQEKMIEIPIKNVGSRVGIISIEDIRTNEYCPHISYPSKSITILPGKTEQMEIQVKPSTLGQLQIKTSFSNMQTCLIKTIVMEDQVQIVDQNGAKVVVKDFGELFIGQRFDWPFFVANSTKNQIDCILQTLNKKKQNAAIKVDKKRNIFISEISPQQFSASVESSCLSLQKNQMQVQPFESHKNFMYLQKVPTKDQINIFTQNLTKNIETTIYKAEHSLSLNRSLALTKDPNQIDYLLTGQNNRNNLSNNASTNNKMNDKDKIINETLAVKFSNSEKIFKIPIKFFAKIPNLQIDLNVLEFGKLYVKEREEKQFVLKNLSTKPVKLNFGDATLAFNENFKIQGPQFLNGLTEQTFKIKFRPLIKKKFAQILRIKVFDHFPIEIKIFGQCLGMDGNSAKPQMSLTMTDRRNQTSRSGNWRSLLKDKTARQITDTSNEFMITMNKSMQKTKMSQSTNLLFPSRVLSKIRKVEASEEQEMAKMVFNLGQENMSSQKVAKESLFFKKDEFLTSTRKNKPFNHPSNLRELLRYQALSLDELKKIEVEEKKLQFGHIFIGSTTSKKFTIKNKLEQPILIELDTQRAESLAQNSSQPIRIEGFGTYEANVVLHPTQLGQLELPLNYVINKQHAFEVKILAIVTLVNLELSARSFVFNLNEDDPSFQKEATLQVFNNGNKKAKFIFDQPENPCFKLSVLQGELEPKSHMTIKIIYCPVSGHESGEQRVDLEKLKMRVQDGAQNIIKCTGTVKQPKISIKQTEFICENSVVSVPISNKISIKNLSKVQTYIRIEFEPLNQTMNAEEIASCMSIESSMISLAADDKKQITFTLLCHETKRIEVNIVLWIRGLTTVRIPFTANVVYPDVLSLVPEINFQDVPIMSNYCIEMFSLINRTQTEIKLEIDPNYPKDEYLCQILAVKDRNLQINYDDEKNKTFVNSFNVDFKDNRRVSKRKSIVSNKIMVLPPGEQSLFNLKFVPKSIMKYDFQLPLKIYGSSQKVIRPVNIQIKCNAIDPVIYVEPRVIKFDMKVINEAKTSYSQSVFISNPHNYPVRFKIVPLMRNCLLLSSNNKKNLNSMNTTASDKFRRDERRCSSLLQNNQNFTFSQSEGDIDSNDKIEIFVLFKASSEGEFTEKFSIFLGPKSEQIKSQTPVSSYVLDVSGSAIMPTLRFSCNEAILPIVPLNLESRIYVMIQNHGYDAITICKWKTSNHFSHTDIKVNFIEGKLLSLAKKSLRIEIVFSSLAPISFTTMLQFYDEYGNNYELPISCTADNSIFTCYPYLESDNQHTILYNTEEKMIKVMPTGKNPYYDNPKQLSGSHAMTCGFIQKWINFQLNMNIKSYPSSMIESDGKEFVKLINRISSKTLIKKNQYSETLTDQQPEQILTETNQKGNVNKILYLVQLYSETIKKLKQDGAFLNQIRPEFLLNYSQYINYQNHKRKLACSRMIFEVVSVQSWIALFYQLCKIYFQSQINEKMLSKVKVESGLIPGNTTSNLYSSAQIILLKFINYYLSPEDGPSNHSGLMISFSEHINIYEMIHRLLEITFKLSLSEQLNALKNSVAIMSPHVFLSSIAKFLYTHLKQFGLSSYLGNTDLFTMGVKQLVLYLINLFQMIYHYSNASLIKFEGAVGDKITKVIELENPTSKKVNYTVKIASNFNDSSTFDRENLKTNTSGLMNTSEIPNKSLLLCKSSSSLSQITSFVSEVHQITIRPREKAQLKIVYHCKNAKGQNANLYLIPKKEDEDFTIPQPLMFKLSTSILSKILMKKIVVTTTLYQVLPIHLDIELPSQIPQSAEFNLYLFEQSCQQSSNNHFFNPQSFIFSQSHVRTLKEGNRDSFELKLIPLSLGEKVCKISYLSSIYGEFIYEIQANITNPKILKEFKFKDLKVNVEQENSIMINKENELMSSLLKVYYPDLYNFQCKTERTMPIQGTKRAITSSSKINLSVIEKASPRDLKYDVQILDNPYVTLVKGYNSIEKLQKQNQILFKTNFTKPCKEFSVILSVKNDLLKDCRLYKVIFVVVSPPKIIKMQFKTSARQQTTQKIPIKISPCEVTLKSNSDAFTIENLCRQYFNNTELTCHFKPQWIQDKEVTIEIQNKESLEQIIYQISLKAEQPQNFGTFQLMGSSLFNEEASIPIDIQQLFSQIIEEETKSTSNNNSSSYSSTLLASKNLNAVYFDIKRLFKRSHQIENDKFYPFTQMKNLKSLTGIKLADPQMFGKETSQKLKTTKTKSLIDDRSLKSINMILHPSDIENETGSIRLSKPHSEEYYWAKIVIRNRPVKKLKPIQLQQKLNHTKIEPIDYLMTQQGIDFNAPDFQFKFSEEQKHLKFTFMQVQPQATQSIRSSSINLKQKRPCIVFNPVKQIETEQLLYLKSNNEEFMLPIQLKADPMPTIVVPEITTLNVQPKLTYINLINGTDEEGLYRVVTFNHDDPKTQCWNLFHSEDQNSFDWIENDKIKGTQGHVYYLKPRQKKQIRICFQPKFIYQKEKFTLKFESQTLPNCTYILNGRSEFKVQQEHAEFEIYEDHIKPFHVNFSNLFHKKENFSIEVQTIEGQQLNSKIDEFIKIEEPTSKRFNLGQGDYKGIVLAIKDAYFQLSQQMFLKKSQQNQDQQNFKFVILIKTAQKMVKKYFITLLVIKNLFSNKTVNKMQQPMNKLKTRYVFEGQKQQSKKTIIKNKNYYHWSCKARQNIYETIEIPSALDFCVKEIKCSPEILKYITFTCISQAENSSQNLEKDQLNHLKIKYSPMKPIKRKKYDVILIGTMGQKYRIQCEIFVEQPTIDDTIVIKTSEIDQIGCVSFKLTNTIKTSAKYRAYFVKKIPEFTVEAENGVLEGYGKPGTAIMVKFRSHINNRRLEDRLIIQTEDMYWCFKVKGSISKDGL